MPTLKTEHWLAIMIVAGCISWISLFFIMRDGNKQHKAIAAALIIL